MLEVERNCYVLVATQGTIFGFQPLPCSTATGPSADGLESSVFIAFWTTVPLCLLRTNEVK